MANLTPLQKFFVSYPSTIRVQFNSFHFEPILCLYYPSLASSAVGLRSYTAAGDTSFNRSFINV